MTPKPPTDAARLDHLRHSLVDHALGQIRRAARSEDLATLAFVGLAAWMDTVAILWAPVGMNAKDAWIHFVNTYMVHRRGYGEKLYVGWRCALLHEYGTGGVILQRGDRTNDHFSTRDGSLVLVLDLLIEDAHVALEQMLTAARGDDGLRRRVLSRSQRLLAPLKPAEVPGNPSGLGTLTGASASPTGMSEQTTAWSRRHFPKK